ncbi:MAG: threonine synthase [Ruminococcaceae bacterium]|nr:threonine synthase [Oscillospiraceae bacterium]
MKFISTRGNGEERVSSAQAIKQGLASDGGLFMPENIPTLTSDELLMLQEKSYPERAAYVIGKFLTDYTYEELLCDASEAYSYEKFGNNAAPVVRVNDNLAALELWHGPTCAFKDMALQIMPRLFVRALRKTNESREALILVATSGDTGKAALEGYRDVNGTKIQVFYPTDGVSKVQKLQMQTQEGKNVSVKAIRGNFDDAQSGVKRIFADSAMASLLNESGVFLSSANSINWGRLVPQIVYYVSAYLDMAERGDIAFGEAIDVCVPTGNFGNIFAAYIAKLMGLPLGRLICASNQNNVLTEFLSSGRYNKKRDFYATISPSMDILISSNLERLLYLVAGPERTRGYMNKLNSLGSYTVDDDIFESITATFIGIHADEDETKATIRRIYEKENYLIDTHTAVAMCAAAKYMNIYKAERKVLVVSTASPYKFAKDVYLSLTGSDASELSDTDALGALSSLTGTEIPTPLAAVLNKNILHPDIIGRDDMDNSVKDFVTP